MLTAYRSAGWPYVGIIVWYHLSTPAKQLRMAAKESGHQRKQSKTGALSALAYLKAGGRGSARQRRKRRQAVYQCQTFPENMENSIGATSARKVIIMALRMSGWRRAIHTIDGRK